APLRLTSTLLLRMITLSLEPFFDGHKHCSPLQPLRARHVLPMNISSLIIRWITPTWKVWSEQNSKGMHLTEAGQTFLREARSILSQSQRGVQLAQAASRGEAGHLDIAYSVAVFDPIPLSAMRLFRQLFPMVVLGLREQQTSHLPSNWRWPT